MAEPLAKVSASKRDARWKEATQAGIRERTEMLERDGMSRDKARRQATHQQEAATNQARAETEGRK